jgi:hypothetical protein
LICSHFYLVDSADVIGRLVVVVVIVVVVIVVDVVVATVVDVVVVETVVVVVVETVVVVVSVSHDVAKLKVNAIRIKLLFVL